MNRITEKTLVSYSCGLWDIEVETDSGADIFRSVRIAHYPNGSNPSIKHYCAHSMKRLASWF